MTFEAFEYRGQLIRIIDSDRPDSGSIGLREARQLQRVRAGSPHRDKVVN